MHAVEPGLIVLSWYCEGRNQTMSTNFEMFSHIELIGQAILPFIRAVSAEALVKTLLRKVGLDDVQPGLYYPLSSHLKLLDDVDKRMPTVLKNAGTFIASEAVFPPEIATFEQFLEAINTVYLMQHRGYAEGEIGQYSYSKESEKVFHMVDDIPYPCRYNEGMYLGFAKRFGVAINLSHTGTQCRRKGDRKCSFRIELK